MPDDGGLHVFLRCVQGTDASPFRGVGLEIGGSLRRTRLPYPGQAREIGGMGLGVRHGEPADGSAELGPGPPVAGAVEYPTAFLKALQ